MRYYSSDCELSLSYWDRAGVELWLIGTQAQPHVSISRRNVTGELTHTRAHPLACRSCSCFLPAPSSFVLRPQQRTRPALTPATLGSPLLHVPCQGLHLHKCSCLQRTKNMFRETNNKKISDMTLHVF